MQENVSRLYANTMLFYIKDLSICGFWYLWGDLEPIPVPDTEGWLYCSENQTTFFKSVSFQKHLISLNNLIKETFKNFQ